MEDKKDKDIVDIVQLWWKQMMLLVSFTIFIWTLGGGRLKFLFSCKAVIGMAIAFISIMFIFMMVFINFKFLDKENLDKENKDIQQSVVQQKNNG